MSHPLVRASLRHAVAIFKSGKAYGPVSVREFSAYVSSDTHLHQPRQDAKKRGETTYLGKPCGKCGEVVKMTVSAECYACRPSMIRKRKTAEISTRLEDAIDAILEECGFTLDEVLSKVRIGPLKDCRWRIWKLMVDNGLSYSEIARRFDCNHTSIIHAVRCLSPKSAGGLVNKVEKPANKGAAQLSEAA